MGPGSRPMSLKLFTNKLFPGERVTGVVDVPPLDAAYPLTLDIEFLGGEKVFIAPNELNRVKMTKAERLDYETRSMNAFALSRVKLDKPQGPSLPVQVSFELEINEGLQPSFLHQCKTKSTQFFACVQYKVVAKLTDASKKSLSKKKVPLMIVSRSTDPGYLSVRQSGHDFKMFSAMFSDKNITLSLRVDQGGLFVDLPNKVRVDIDATHAKSSLVNVKIQLLNFIQIRTSAKVQTCRRMVAEVLVADMLPKKNNYSGDLAHIVPLPEASLLKTQQSVSGRLISNVFALRLVVEKNHGPGVFEFGPKVSELILPVFLRRFQAPNSVNFDTICSEQLGIKDFDIQKLDSELSKVLEYDPKTNQVDNPKARSKSTYNTNNGPIQFPQKSNLNNLEISVPIREETLRDYKKSSEGGAQQPIPLKKAYLV